MGLVSGLVGPGLALGAGIEWGLGLRPLLPFFRVALSWTDNRTTLATFQPHDAAHYRLLAAETQLCVGRVIVAPTAATVAVCSGLEAGQYLAEGIPDGTGQTTGRSYTSFWVSSISNLHARVEGDRMFFDFSPSIRLPFVRRVFGTRDIFSNSGFQAVHHIPFVAWGLAWSVGMSFR